MDNSASKSSLDSQMMNSQPTEIPSFLPSSFPSSPSLFLDPSVLFSSSDAPPSPTTGIYSAESSDFSFQSSKAMPSITSSTTGIYGGQLSDFSFQSSQSMPSFTSSMDNHVLEQQIQLQLPLQNTVSISEPLPLDLPQTIQTSNNNNQSLNLTMQNSASHDSPQSMHSHGYLASLVHLNQMHRAQPQPDVEQKTLSDGFNWRKYGQKQVKGTENPRSYYKCTFPNCSTKKKVESNPDGCVTEIVYTGLHDHPKPLSTRRSNFNSFQIPCHNTASASASVLAMPNNPSPLPENKEQTDSVTVLENSPTSLGENDLTHAHPRPDQEDEAEAKKRKEGDENEGGASASASESASRPVREPKIVLQTTSNILNDGYRWRKYGQKMVKGNPNPRSYYKCTHIGCKVKKHVERAPHNLREIITAYEGTHNHEAPVTRGRFRYNINMPLFNNNAPTANIVPSGISGPSGTNNRMLFPNNELETMHNIQITPYTPPVLPQTMHNNQITPYNPPGAGNDSITFTGFGTSTSEHRVNQSPQRGGNDSMFESKELEDSFSDSFLI